MTPDELVVLVRCSREAQGLPPKVEDPAALARVAGLLVVGSDVERKGS
jgi:hypothetical protein